jgi:TetR/AcrR family tetracycline transcriptional repressor
VLAVAARLLEEVGIEGLSMRRLASALGTGPATLYWHVRDKDELLEAILDDSLRDVAGPSSGDWADRLVVLLGQCRVALRARPTLVLVLWEARWDLGPQTLRVADEIVGLVAASGLPEEEVADAYFALLNFTLGVVSTEARTPGNRYPTGEGDYPNLARYAPGTDAQRMDRRFDTGLRLLVAGITARAAAAG